MRGFRLSSSYNYSDDTSTPMIGGAVEFDYLTQRVVRLNNYFAAYHECLMNQFQHFRLEFVWLEHQLRRLSQDMIDSNSYCHLNVMQWKLEGMLRRMESVHMAQRNIASVSLQLQQHQQGINSKYNLILQQHLTRVIINMAGVPQPQQEQQGSGRNEFDNNFVHEFVQNELSMTELSQSNSGESTHDWVMVGMNFARHSYFRKL